MKKKNVSLIMLASIGMMLTFSACKKCVECTYRDGTYIDSDVLCKPEEYTTKAWQSMLDEYEDEGYNCENL